MWSGSNARRTFGSKSVGKDYFLAITEWRRLIEAHGKRVDLIVKIDLQSQADYTLVYSNFKLYGDLSYSHDGGKCPQGNCPSGPQMQHDDPRKGKAPSKWFDGACCCSNNNGFGWYGSCGFGQFGFVADSAHGGKFSHPIDRNGNYVNPPVGSDARGYGNIL